jgi:hypothetical protein
VHRLELGLAGPEFLDRADPEHGAVAVGVAVAEERDRGLHERVDVEREAMLGRRLRQAERQVPLQQRPHVRLAGVVNGDQAGGGHPRHCREGCITAV